MTCRVYLRRFPCVPSLPIILNLNHLWLKECARTKQGRERRNITSEIIMDGGVSQDDLSTAIITMAPAASCGTTTTTPSSTPNSASRRSLAVPHYRRLNALQRSLVCPCCVAGGAAAASFPPPPRPPPPGPSAEARAQPEGDASESGRGLCPSRGRGCLLAGEPSPVV